MPLNILKGIENGNPKKKAKELIAWTVGETTEYSSGDVVDPEKVLTEEEYKRYTASLQDFIAGFE